MEKKRIIKITLILSVVVILYVWISMQRFPEENDGYNICGKWKYQSGLDEDIPKLYIIIHESGTGTKYDIEIYEKPSDELKFSGYLVVDSYNELTVFSKEDNEFELPESWKKMKSVQKLSYKFKNKLFSNEELHVRYEDETSDFMMVFTKIE